MYLSKNILKIFKNLSQNSQYLFLHAFVYPVHRGYTAIHILCALFQGILFVPKREKLFFPRGHIRIFFYKVNFGFYKIGYSQHSTYFFLILVLFDGFLPFFFLRTATFAIIVHISIISNIPSIAAVSTVNNYCVKL